jgi:hypothetical protein
MLNQKIKEIKALDMVVQKVSGHCNELNILKLWNHMSAKKENPAKPM